MSRTFENEDIRVDYKIIDESFDHEFGRTRTKGFEIESVYVYVPAIKDWYDVGHLSQFITAAYQLIQNEMEKAA